MMCSYYVFLYSHWLPQPLHDVISQLDNCNDILVNFLVSHVTRRPPITVAHRLTSSGRHGNAELPFPTAESWSFHTRQYCIGRFTELLGHMPLIRSSVRFDPLLYRDPVSILRKKYRHIENVAL